MGMGRNSVGMCTDDVGMGRVRLGGAVFRVEMGWVKIRRSSVVIVIHVHSYNAHQASGYLLNFYIDNSKT